MADVAPATTYRNDTGARMLETGKAINDDVTKWCTTTPDATKCAAKTQALNNFRQNIEIMRSLHNAFGYATYKTDAPLLY